MRSIIYTSAWLTGMTEGAVVHPHDCQVLRAPYLGESGCVEAGSPCPSDAYRTCDEGTLVSIRNAYSGWVPVISGKFGASQNACMNGREDAVESFETMVRGKPKRPFNHCDVNDIRQIYTKPKEILALLVLDYYVANFDGYISGDKYSIHMNNDVFLNMHHMGGDAGLRAEFAQYMILHAMRQKYSLLSADVSAANALIPTLISTYLASFITDDTPDEHHLRDILMHFLSDTTHKTSPSIADSPFVDGKQFLIRPEGYSRVESYCTYSAMFELFDMVQPQTETVSGRTITWGLFAEALKAAGQTAEATEAMAAIEAKSPDRKAGMDFLVSNFNEGNCQEFRSGLQSNLL